MSDNETKNINSIGGKQDSSLVRHLLESSDIPKEYFAYSWRSEAKYDGEKVYDVKRNIIASSLDVSCSARRAVSDRKFAWRESCLYSKNLEENARDGRSLLFIGGKNSGKTVLGTLILRDAIKRFGMSGKFISFASFMSEIDQSFGENFTELISIYSYGYDFLMIDEIEPGLSPRSRVKDCMSTILSNRKYVKNPTIITSKAVFGRKSTETIEGICGTTVANLLNDSDIYKRISILGLNDKTENMDIHALIESGLEFDTNILRDSFLGCKSSFVNKDVLTNFLREAITSSRQEVG